jgi:hypothetical protein
MLTSVGNPFNDEDTNNIKCLAQLLQRIMRAIIITDYILCRYMVISSSLKLQDQIEANFQECYFIEPYPILY